MTGQLPPAGGTSSGRPAEPPPTDALSLDEAVAAYGVSQSTLRRRLREEQVAGAYKVHGPKGAEWRIPNGALEALGYERAKPTIFDDPAAEIDGSGYSRTPPPPSPDVERLADVVEQLTSLVEGGQRQLMAAEEDRGQAARRIEQLVAENARLEAELAHARRRRWPFRR